MDLIITKKMKLCYILPEYNQNTDSHFYHHYERLEKLSDKLDVFLIAEKGSYTKGKTLNMKRFYIQKFKFLPFRFLENLFIILRARMLGYKKFYTHISYISAINAVIVSRLFGGKSYYWNCAMNWLFKQRTLPGWGYKLSMKLSHYLVTGSEEMKKGYAENYGLSLDKIKVIPNWVNPERFKPIDKKQGRTILFVHWLSKRKGADILVPIMNNLKFKIKNLKLMVIGDGPYKNKLIDEIKDNGLEKQINVLGMVPNKEIADYYNRADVLIMPSMEEGFPRVLLEAMASGVPYVASDVGAVREISPEIAQRFLVKAGDTEMFAHKIETLLSDEIVYEQFRKEELEKIKEYSLENVINKFIKIIS